MPVHTPDPGAPAERAGYLFFGVLASLSLLADAWSKGWAEVELTARGARNPLVLWESHLNLALAYNRGGAWGLLQDASDLVRRPFFLIVSASAVAFIVSLYSKVRPYQHSLRWGLPLVLGGALGNLVDRITRGAVVDFIDYRASWVATMNRGVASIFSNWHVTEHWPTFNVADISICTGVGLMILDIFARRGVSMDTSANQISD